MLSPQPGTTEKMLRAGCAPEDGKREIEDREEQWAHYPLFRSFHRCIRSGVAAGRAAMIDTTLKRTARQSDPTIRHPYIKKHPALCRVSKGS